MAINKKSMPDLDEHKEQCLLIQWFKIRYPSLAKRLYAIPNGGLRDVRVARKLKAEGVQPGVADLFLMVANDGYFGLYIEMKKTKGGLQSQAQKEFESLANESGYKYFLAHGFEEARKTLEDYINKNPTKVLNLKSGDGIEDDPSNWITTQEAIERLGLSRPTIYKLIANNQLQAITSGRKYLINIHSLQKV